MDVFGVYKKLFKIYGSQGWWPVFVRQSQTTPGKLDYTQIFLPRGAKMGVGRYEYGLTYGIAYNKLKKNKTLFRDTYFEIAVGAILTQSAAWKNVALAINNLYQAKVLMPQKIVKLNTARLQKLIRPVGYFKQKTKKLKIFSKWLVDNYDGDIRRLSRFTIHGTRDKLLKIWGIGPETADSIILYALNKPIFVIDEYTRRLCAKFRIKFKTYDEYQKFFELSLRAKRSNPIANSRTRGLPRSLRSLAMTQIFREYHALVVASGKDKHEKLIIK